MPTNWLVTVNVKLLATSRVVVADLVVVVAVAVELEFGKAAVVVPPDVQPPFRKSIPKIPADKLVVSKHPERNNRDLICI